MIKVILKETYTKRDYSGNVYHTVTVVNVRNRKSFTTQTPSMGNVIGILKKTLSLEWEHIYECSRCTDSTRTSSLPDHLNLRSCQFDDGWKVALNKIGFRISNKDKPL